MDWSVFYASQLGRAVRPTFLAAETLFAGRPPGFAIDLGCGDGLETQALLQGGWRVLAIDGSPDVLQRVRGDGPPLEVRRMAFEEITVLPPADLVYAGYSLPFCSSAHFPTLWAAIRGAIAGGGTFAGELFGPEDSWAGDPEVDVHSRAEVEGLLGGLEVVRLDEENSPGTSFRGPKNWHVFHIVARAR